MTVAVVQQHQQQQLQLQLNQSQNHYTEKALTKISICLFFVSIISFFFHWFNLFTHIHTYIALQINYREREKNQKKEGERGRHQDVELKEIQHIQKKIQIESCDSVIVWYNKILFVKYLSEIIMIYLFNARV